MWDWGSSKWEIWRFPENGEAHHVLTVQTSDKSYRELGTDILLRLQQIDTTRYTTKELVRYFDELDNQLQRRKRKELMDMIGDITIETQQYARGVLQIQVPNSLKVRRVICHA